MAILEGYENRFVAFIDILGFKQIINNIEGLNRTHETDFSKIKSILNFLNEESQESNGNHDLPIYERVEGGILEKELGDPRITYVSDCVIISTNGDIDGFKALCNKITKFTTDLASDGIFTRGAITYGKIYHHGRILFGSAYQTAYSLESDAKYPRIIIDELVFEILKDNIGKIPLTKAFINTDLIDEKRYLVNFPFNYFPYYTFKWLDFLLRIKGHILYYLNLYDERVTGYPMNLRNLEKYYIWKDTYTRDLDFTGGNSKVLEKYQWLKDEFNRTIDVYNDIYKLNSISKIIWDNNIWGPEEILGDFREDGSSLSKFFRQQQQNK